MSDLCIHPNSVGQWLLYTDGSCQELIAVFSDRRDAEKASVLFSSDTSAKVASLNAFISAILSLEPHVDEPAPVVEALLDKVKALQASSCRVAELEADNAALRRRIVALEAKERA